MIPYQLGAYSPFSFVQSAAAPGAAPGPAPAPAPMAPGAAPALSPEILARLQMQFGGRQLNGPTPRSQMAQSVLANPQMAQLLYLMGRGGGMRGGLLDFIGGGAGGGNRGGFGGGPVGGGFNGGAGFGAGGYSGPGGAIGPGRGPAIR